MTQLVEIDWDMLKFQYEVLGYELTALQQEYGVTDQLLGYMSRKWERLPISMREQLDFPQMGDYGDFNEAMLNKIRKEIDATSLVKQKGIYTLYVELERTLLLKSVRIARTLTEDTTSIAHIRNLLSTLHKLIEKNPLVSPQVEVEEAAPQKVQVEFTNANNNTTEVRAISDEAEAV